MVDFLQFLRVYGALMACAAAIVVLAAVMASCTLRMKRLEKRVSEMEEALQKRMDDESRKNREDALRQRIQRCIRERCGLAMHPHLFRHLAGKLTLDTQPGAYGLVRDMLGHKSVNTTTSYYAGMETKGALQRYDEQVLRLRDGEASSPPRGARRRRA